MNVFSKSERIFGVAILILTFAWRLMDLDAPTLWFDEAFTWRLISFPFFEMITRAQEDFSPPFYYILLYGWTALFGDSVFVMRLLSVVWMGIAITAAFFLCKESKKMGLGKTNNHSIQPHFLRLSNSGQISALMLSASPFLFRYSQEVRMYIQEIALIIVSSWLLLRVLREKKRILGWWCLYGLSEMALAYTHNIGLFFVVAQTFYASINLVFSSSMRLDPVSKKRQIVSALTIALVCACLYLPWFTTLRRQQKRVSEDYWAQHADKKPLNNLQNWCDVALQCILHNKASGDPVDRDIPNIEYIGYVIIVGFGITLTLLLTWNADRLTRYLALGIILPIMLLVGESYHLNRNIITPRYLIGSYTLLLVGVAQLIDRINAQTLRLYVCVAIILNLLFFTYGYKSTLDSSRHTGLRGAADYIVSRSQTCTHVVCLDPLDYFSMKYYLRNRCSVHLARLPGQTIPIYHGAAALTPDDFVPWSTVNAAADLKFWLVRNGLQNANYTLNSRWIKKDSTAYSEAIFMRGDTILELWESEMQIRKQKQENAK